MCEICTAKAQNISRLASFFREKSDEAKLVYYIQRMSEAAAVLDQQATYFSTQCRCGDDSDEGFAAVIPDADQEVLSPVWLG